MMDAAGQRWVMSLEKVPYYLGVLRRLGAFWENEAQRAKYTQGKS